MDNTTKEEGTVSADIAANVNVLSAGFKYQW